MIHLPGYGDSATFPRGASSEPRHELPEGWTPWRGGKLAPIDDGVLHQVMMRDGWISPADDEASTWDWECCGDFTSDIVAYRIVES